MDGKEVGLSHNHLVSYAPKYFDPVKGDHYIVMTHWRSKEYFERWTEGQGFMEAHADTPPKEAFSGPSKLEVHEVIAESSVITQPV